jgi:hypothetical protein
MKARFKNLKLNIVNKLKPLRKILTVKNLKLRVNIKLKLEILNKNWLLKFEKCKIQMVI